MTSGGWCLGSEVGRWWVYWLVGWVVGGAGGGGWRRRWWVRWLVWSEVGWWSRVGCVWVDVIVGWLDGMWVECGVVGRVGGGRCGGGVGSAVCGPSWSNGVWWILRRLVSQGWSSPSSPCATMSAWRLVGRSAVYTSQSGSIGPLHKTCLACAGGCCHFGLVYPCPAWRSYMRTRFVRRNCALE